MQLVDERDIQVEMVPLYVNSRSVLETKSEMINNEWTMPEKA